MIVGNRTPGATTFALGGDRKQLIDVALTRGGYLTDMTVYLDGKGSGGAQSVRGVLYERTTGTLVLAGATQSVNPGGAAGWRQLTFDSHPLLAPGNFAIGVHAGPAGCARGFHSGGAGLSQADTFADGPTTTLAPTATSTGLSLIATASEAWTPPATAPDEYLAALPPAEAQSVFSVGGPIGGRLTRVGWHGTRTDPATGSYAVVREGTVMEDLLGERVRLTVGARSTCVYVHDALAITEDISVTRRSFMELASPATAYVRAFLVVLT